ncbi:MAG TPA: DUF192 domain-containing protein, partial [Anaeromyxobacteraceae bacterium]|nr:DUF192 domain-containing protein [Anaeromyxobacteraceae bacterium]
PSTAAPAPPGRVVVSSPSGRESSVAVEVARTPDELARGLMNRTSLAEDAGMLFVFPATEEHTFWMKNTLIPLDMIFISEDRTVVGVVADAAPLTLDARSPGVASRYVLEVTGGWAARHGVAPGDRVAFEGVAP